ncbi:hypothetical protein CU097_002206, partial [Rhizopus azygosporus]
DLLVSLVEKTCVPVNDIESALMHKAMHELVRILRNVEAFITDNQKALVNSLKNISKSPSLCSVSGTCPSI